MERETELPVWAPRVAQWKVRRLYENDAAGICDEELIDDVGTLLLARCESFITAVEATAGRAACPRCGSVVNHRGDRSELLRCACGWELSWGEYFGTIQHRQLSGAEPVLALFRDYLARYPAARAPHQKVLQIDRLLHGFHWFFKNNTPTRPVAINLIEGRLGEVLALLDELSYGPGSTRGLPETRAEWERNAVLAHTWHLQQPKKDSE
jgi:hypothetical protein